MTSFNVEQARLNMILQQIRPWDVLDQTVLDVLAAIPREKFVPSGMEKLAFSDCEIPIGFGESMMAPRVEGRLLQALDLKPDDEILEIGTGSGFLTACLARLGRSVTSVERHEPLKAAAEQRLRELGIENAHLDVGDAAHGWSGGPYDAIAVTGSLPEYDSCFERMLKVGGRLFIIVGAAPVMEATLITRVGETHFARTKIFETTLKPLAGREPKPRFVF